jgi:CRP-like cAMP-binding protein
MTRGPPTLAHTPLYATLDAADIRALDARCVWRKVQSGEWVFDHESDGGDVFFVFGGRARVVIGGSGREIILRDIDDGEYFGELSALDGRPLSSERRSIAIRACATKCLPPWSGRSATSMRASTSRSISAFANASAPNCFACPATPPRIGSSCRRRQRMPRSPRESARIAKQSQRS